MAEKILLCINAAWNVANFRAGLVRRLIAEGYDVVAAVPDDGAIDAVERLGVRVIETPMDNKGVSPLKDLLLLRRLYRTLRRERPDVYLGWTVKPNIYGTIASRMLNIASVNNISGLGTAFIRENWLTTVVEKLYRMALRKSDTVFFQNATDRDLFVSRRLVNPTAAALLPGSGIDTSWFDPAAFSAEPDGVFRFLLIARLVRDKGVNEYIEAARIVQAHFPGTRFEILGFLDVQNRTAITRSALNSWVAAGIVDYLGAAEDVRPHIARADCIVLPSYREGTSRVLLEAAAMATPAIATDVPGCSDVIRDGRTGFLCSVRDPQSLAEAMIRMLALSTADRATMGTIARAMVIESYAESIVIDRYVEVIQSVLAARGRETN